MVAARPWRSPEWGTSAEGALGVGCEGGGTGVGIVGMRERAESVGGRLDAGPTPDGGFRLRAVVPYHRRGA